MVDVLRWVLIVTVWLWLAAEAVMLFRQFRMGGRAKVTEWGSLGVIVLAFAVGTALGRLAAHALPGPRLPVGTAPLLAVTVALAWAGIALRLWAIRTLGRFFRVVVHVQADHEVVRSGPYRVLRHPSYTGALVAVLGLSLTMGNVAAIVVFLACGVAGVGYRIRVEERVLFAELGQRYAEYAAGTSRLIPHVW